MKKQKVTLLLIFLFLSACSSFQSEYRSLTPTVFPPPTTSLSSPTPKVTTSFTPANPCELPTTMRSSETSPNGDWFVVNCEDSKYNIIYTQIFNTNDSRSWKINYANFKSYKFFELDYRTNSPFHWSKNETNLYIEKYSPLHEGSEPSTGNLLQIDLATGQTHDLFSEFNRTVYTFSPDNNILIYFTPNIESNKIYVMDLENQEVKTIELDESYFSINPFGLWSNDNQNFVASLTDSSGADSLIVINAVEITQRALFSNPPDLLFPLEWKNQDEVMVTSSLFYNRFPEAKIWLINIHSGEIIKIR